MLAFGLHHARGFEKEPLVGVLKEALAGVKVGDLARKHCPLPGPNLRPSAASGDPTPADTGDPLVY
jgi:hypothetical protein